MAETDVKHGSPTEKNTYSSEEAGEPAGNKPWYLREFRIGGIRIPWYASPPIQLLIVSITCFLCPGMFNALQGMGGGGQVDASVANKANTALYSTFSVVSFFAGTIVNTLGVKAALSFGGSGYAVYIASFLCYNYTHNEGFNIFAGAWLGCCAGCLWTAQGAVMMSYPDESRKGKYVSWFWGIFNLGAVLGSLISLGQNIHSEGNTTVSNGTYIGYLVLTLFGAIVAWTLVPTSYVVRRDGSKVIMKPNPTWTSEFYGLYKTFKTDTYIIFLFPMFFASNWFYTYQFNDVNLAKFTTRTRALNNTLYWLMQIVGAFIFGYCADLRRSRRRHRALGLWIVMFTTTMAIWGGGYAFQKNYTREEVSPDSYVKIDWTDSSYIGPMFLYMFYGFYDAAWQTTVYWTMGALSNSSRKLANFAGLYKGIQSAGSAIIWSLDNDKKPYINLFASCWALLGGALIIAAPVMYLKIKDTIPEQQDLDFSETNAAEIVDKRIAGDAHNYPNEKYRDSYVS